MKKLSGISILVALLIIGAHQVAVTFNSVPPAAKTGAPGEVSCITLGCHPGFGNTGSISVTFNNGSNVYYPDSVYEIEITLEDAGNSIFGFQLTPLDVLEQPQGDFILTNFTNTALSVSAGREYISHFNAFDSLNFGVDFRTWTFQWKAPAIAQDSIIFYFAGIAANQMISIPVGNFYMNNLGISPTTVNLTPIANNQSITILKDSTLMIDLTVASYDPNGDTIGYYMVSNSDSGLATVFGPSSIQYIPNPGFVGQDTITYAVCDGGPMCDTGMVFLNVSLTPGVKMISDAAQFNIYPNPSSGLINVEVLSLITESVNIKLFNINGKLIWNAFGEDGNSGILQTDLSDCPSGMYFVNIVIGQETYVKKLILLK